MGKPSPNAIGGNMTADTKRPREYFVQMEPQSNRALIWYAWDVNKPKHCTRMVDADSFDALAAELAACKASMNAHDKSRAKVLLKVAELEAERDQLLAPITTAETWRILKESGVDTDLVQALEKQVAELRICKTEMHRYRDMWQALEKKRSELKEKLAAAEAVRERLERKLGAADKEHAELLQWCEKLNDCLDTERHAIDWPSDKRHAFIDKIQAEFEAWKKERGV